MFSSGCGIAAAFALDSNSSFIPVYRLQIIFESNFTGKFLGPISTEKLMEFCRHFSD